MMGTYQASSLAAFIMTTGIITGAAYMLYLYRRVAYGPLDKPDVAAMTDLSARELVLLVPLALVTIWMGVYPESFMAPMRKDVGFVLARTDRAWKGGDAKLVANAHPHLLMLMEPTNDRLRDSRGERARDDPLDRGFAPAARRRLARG
jgi:NADH-quinone oxidoreductase subunit M